VADRILMNKNTLAALKIDLAAYREALPVFEMKEQQLKGVVQSIEAGIISLKEDIEKTNDEIKNWVAVMAENVELSKWVEVDKVVTEQEEIAGVTVESYMNIHFATPELDYFKTPLWVDDAIEAIVEQKTKRTIVDIEQKKLKLLQEELDEARRMKNTLKEVFIPETKELIRKIEIYLGDVERLAIGCAKLVKKKKIEKQEKQAMA